MRASCAAEARDGEEGSRGHGNGEPSGHMQPLQWKQARAHEFAIELGGRLVDGGRVTPGCGPADRELTAYVAGLQLGMSIDDAIADAGAVQSVEPLSPSS